MWTGLLTYRYLNKTNPVLDAGCDRESMPLRHDMRNAHGGVMAAPLAIACPEPWWNDSETIPAPLVASLQILDDARGVRRVEVVRDVVHIGRKNGFSRSRIVDADDPARVIATSAGMGVSLGDVPGGYEKADNAPLPVEDAPGMPRLHEVFGAVRGGDGLWRLPPLEAEQAAPHAALHLGPIHIVLETAAMNCAADFARTDGIQVESWFVMFSRPGVTGPFRATASALPASRERIHVDLTLHDEGRGDRVITTGSASFRRIDPGRRS